MIDKEEIQEINELIDKLLYEIYEESIDEVPMDARIRAGNLCSFCMGAYGVEAYDFYEMLDEKLDYWGLANAEMENLVVVARKIIEL